MIRPLSRLRSARGQPTGFTDTPYRDSKDARIRALESRNGELEHELAETKREVARQGELIEELWFRRNGVERASPQLGPTSLAAGTCFLIVTGFVAGGLSMLPANTAASRVNARLSPPTMIDLPALTSGGEILAPRRLYAIVIVTPPYDEGLGRCFDGRLVLEPLYAFVDLSEEGEWIRIVWFLATFEPDSPIPYPQL
jgi:hypothetical protein